MRDSKSTFIILVFFLFFLLRIWGVHFGLPFDGIHPTENFSISQSLQHLTTGNLKPKDFQHPSLLSYLISILSSLLFIPPKNYPYIYLIGRLISCLASYLSVCFLYRLARDLFNSRALGLVCASFLGLNPLSIKYAHYAVPDSLCLFFIVLSLWFSLKILKDPSLKNYCLCGLFAGLSLASKFPGFISLGFLLCSHLLCCKNKAGVRGHKLAMSLWLLFLVFLVISPFHLIYFKEALRDYYQYLLERGYFVTSTWKSYGFFTYPFILLPGIFGVLAVLSSLLGLVMMFLKDRTRTFILFVPVLIYFLVIGIEKGGVLQNLLPLLPVLSIFATSFFVLLRDKRINKALMVTLAILVFLPNLTKVVIFDYFLLKPDTRILAQHWLIDNVEKGTKIGFERYTPFDLNYIENSRVQKRFKAVYFVPSLSLYPASFYKEQGYDYIVTSGFRADNYQVLCQEEGVCEGMKNYASYDSQLKLTAVFATPGAFKFTGVSLPWGTWPHQPTIKIYKIK